ncbi:MAG TPA: septal ring lytic transglycosylase RlpA family protein [Terriglobia bacterium]|nr:septal ring lytic transglycosylase RlpA family protein [Terriglobia bacterium]
MRKLIMGCTVAALTMIASPSEGRRAAIKPLKMPAVSIISQFGVASWYGADFQGLPTASGPPFDMDAMTCAHRKLPLGTRIRVTDLMNLRSAVLKVNDRGPFVGNRVLDVSRAAAKCLGFLGAGLAPVRIEVVSYPGQCVGLRPIPMMVASATTPARQ